MENQARVGDYLVICDRSGFKVWASDTVMEWTGLRVDKRFVDKRNPQDFLRGVKESCPPKNTRPEPEDTFLSPGDVTQDDL